MPLDFRWWAKAISSIPACPVHCAGYKLKDFETAKLDGPKPGVHYQIDGFPRTILCDHQDCQVGVEYEYFFMWLVSQNHLNAATWKRIRPRPDNRTGDEDDLDDGGGHIRMANDNAGIPNYCYPLLRVDGCCGFQLADGPLANRLERDEVYNEYVPRQAWHYNPISCAPYTTCCQHNGTCDPFAVVKWIMIKAIATGILPDIVVDPMKVIEEQGWRACFREAHSYKDLMTSPGQWPNNAILWRPDNVDRVGVGDDEGENRFRLKCYYRAISGGPIMVNLKRSPKTGNADMYINFLLQADTLPLIEKLCGYWISAGQDKEKLRTLLTKCVLEMDEPLQIQGLRIRPEARSI